MRRKSRKDLGRERRKKREIKQQGDREYGDYSVIMCYKETYKRSTFHCLVQKIFEQYFVNSPNGRLLEISKARGGKKKEMMLRGRREKIEKTQKIGCHQGGYYVLGLQTPV